MPIFVPAVVSMLAAGVLVVVSTRRQLSTREGFNPDWPAHARFHAGTYGLTRVGASLVAAGLAVIAAVGGGLDNLWIALLLLAVLDVAELGVFASPTLRALVERDYPRWPTLVHLAVIIGLALEMLS